MEPKVSYVHRRTSKIPLKPNLDQRTTLVESVSTPCELNLSPPQDFVRTDKPFFSTIQQPVAHHKTIGSHRHRCASTHRPRCYKPRIDIFRQRERLKNPVSISIHASA